MATAIDYVAQQIAGHDHAVVDQNLVTFHDVYDADLAETILELEAEIAAGERPTPTPSWRWRDQVEWAREEIASRDRADR